MRRRRFYSVTAAIVLLAGCGDGVDLETARQFQTAEETFRQAQSPDDYLRAAALYQQILDAGTVSGVVLYNQGNAFVRAGEHGRAIACYRQAQRYRPRDPYLAANLSHALAQAGQSTAPRNRPLAEMILFWQDWWGYDEKFHLVTWAAGITLALGILGQLLSRQRLWNRLALAGLVLTGLLAISAGYDWYRFESIQRGVVVADEIVARKGDSDNYDPAFNEPLGEGTEFTVQEERGGWLFVRIAGAGEGWIPQTAAVSY